LPDQVVTTIDGIVLNVDCNLVYRVVDVHKALIEIDNLEEGMTQLLSLAVQGVLGGASLADLKQSEELDAELDRRMNAMLEPWGVLVEAARFASISPNAKSLRVTQLARALDARRVAMGALETDVTRGHALGLLGAGNSRYVQRGERLRATEVRHRHSRNWIRPLMRRGLSRASTISATRAWQDGEAPVLANASQVRRVTGTVRLVVLGVLIGIPAAISVCCGLF
jgi:hypothetical protein